jgi:hypothetical protein
MLLRAFDQEDGAVVIVTHAIEQHVGALTVPVLDQLPV